MSFTAPQDFHTKTEAASNNDGLRPVYALISENAARARSRGQAAQAALYPRDSALARGLSDGLRDVLADARVEGGGDDELGVQLFVADEIRESHRRGYLHLLVDVARAHVESAAENAREGQHVVDLVVVVAAPRADDRRASLERELRHDFGRRVRHREEHGLRRHRAYHILRDDAGGGDTDKDVRAAHRVGERAGPVFMVRDFYHGELFFVRARGLFADDALAVAEQHVADADREQQARDGDSGGSRPVHDDADVGHLLIHELQRVDERRERDDRRTMLVVVENGDVERRLQRALDFKTARRRDVLEVDSAEAAREERHGLHNLVHVMRAHAERNRVHAAKFLEEDALPLHDRHSRLRPDIAEAEHCGAVRDDGDGVPAARELVAQRRVLLYFKAGLGNPGRIGQRKLFLIAHRQRGSNPDLPLPFTMQPQTLFRVVHITNLSFDRVSITRDTADTAVP